MKALHTLSLAATLLAVPSIALSGLIEPPVVGSVAPVTLALVFSYTGPNTLAKDENGKVITNPTFPAFYNEWHIETTTKSEHYREELTKIKTVKFGNKEFLLELIDSGVLETESIAGWTIVQVTPSFQYSDVGANTGNPHFFAVHAGVPAVDITEALDGMELATAFTWTLKYAAKGPIGEPENAVVTLSDVSTSKGTLSLNVSFPSPTVTGGEPAPPFVFLQGLFTGTQKLTSIGTGVDKRPLVLLGPQKIGTITGVGPVILEGGYPSVVEGSISIGQSKGVADVTTPYGITEPNND